MITDERSAAVAHAYDALRPGGQLFVFDMRLLPSGARWLQTATKMLRLIYRALAGFTGSDVAAELQHKFDDVQPVFATGQIGTLVMLAVATKAARPGGADAPTAGQFPPETADVR
jgi:hypothetical protein